MGERHDYVALEWVKGEIAETLKQARQALEDYVEDPQDLTQLNFCLTYIHQVHGTLQMVEFFGAALLAEEMEQLAQALIDGKISNLNEALEVMMQAIIQLPLYLDRIQSARRDLPLVILPLLNDLRAARDEKLLSETSLFAPALIPAGKPLAADKLNALQQQGLPALLRKLRQAQQIALVGLMRNQEPEKNLTNMARVFAALEKISSGSPAAPLWQVALGLIDGLANKSLELSASVRALMRQLDTQLRQLNRLGGSGLNEPPPADLLKNLLFYVAKAQPNSKRLAALHEKYQLVDAVPSELMLLEERAHLAGPDRSTIRSVINALSEEFTYIKDRLDLFVRSDRSNLDELAALQAPLKQVGDTLAVLGFAQPRKVILDQIETIAGLTAQTIELNDATLMDIAGALLYLEATLSGMAGQDDSEEQVSEQNLVPTTDVAKLHKAVFKEARTGLEQAKDHIIAFIATKWNHEHLEEVPNLLTQVRGGLEMIPLNRAARLVDSCCKYVENELLAQQKVPSWQDLDCLADAITSVEYYLERLFEEHESKNDAILDMAQQSLAELGYYEEITGSGQAETADEAEQAALEEQTAQADGAEQPAEADTESAAVPAGEPELADGLEHEPASELESEPEQHLEPESAATAQEQVAGALDTVELEHPGKEAQEEEFGASTGDAEDLDLGSLLGAPAAETASEDDVFASLPEIELATAPEPQTDDGQAQEQSIAEVLARPEQEQINPPAQLDSVISILPPADDEEQLDEELQEIFIEEAGEVMENIDEHFPLWRHDTSDKNSLTEIRRAFHTLKGSGRMVKALIVGELSWAIENLLNRVIEGTVEPGADVLNTIEQVIALIPGLVQEFADKQQRQRADVDLLANIAHALAKKQPIEQFVTGSTAAGATDEQQLAEQQETASQGLPELYDIDLDLPEPASAQPQPDMSGQASDIEQLPDDMELTSEVTHRLQDAGLEPALIDIFYNESIGHMRALAEFNQLCAERLPRQITDELQRSLHTLKGSAHMSGVEPIAALVTPLEKLVKEYRAYLLNIDEVEAGLLLETEQLLWQGIRQLSSTPLAALPGADELVARMQALLQQNIESISVKKSAASGDNPLLIIELMSEGLDLLLEMDEQLEQWRKDSDSLEVPVDLLEELSTLQSAAQMAEIPAIVELCDALQRVYLALDNGTIDASLPMFDELESAHGGLISMLDEVAASLKVTPQPELVQQMLQLPAQYAKGEPAGQMQVQESEVSDELALEQLLELEHAQVAQQATEDADISLDELMSGMVVEHEEQTGHKQEQVAGAPQSPAADFDYSAVDEEMAEIFLEEAQELIETANIMLENWLGDGNLSHMNGLMRNLHTIKGGARMAEIGPIGDLSHELEYIYEGVVEGRFTESPELAQLLHAAHDELASQIDLLAQRQNLFTPQQLIARLQQYRRDGFIATEEHVSVPPQTVAPEPGAGTAAEVAAAEEVASIAAAPPGLDTSVGAEAQPLSFDPEYDVEIDQPSPAPQAESEQEESTAQPAPAVTRVDFERDSELVEIFLEEGFELIEKIAGSMQKWLQDTDNLIEVTVLQRHLHTLKGGARMAEISEIGDLSHELEYLYEDLGNSRLVADAALIELLYSCHDCLAEMLEQLRDNLQLSDSQALVERVRCFRTGSPCEPADGGVQSQPQPAPDAKLDSDLIGYFAQDASSHLAILAGHIGEFAASAGEQRTELLGRCLDVLTPLKSASQLAGQLDFARMSNQLEQELLKVEMGVGKPEVLTQILSQLQSAIGQLGQTGTASNEPIEQQLQAPVTQQITGVAADSKKQAQEAIAKALPFVRRAQELAERKAGERSSQEQVRVPSELLEQLVNLAGETSIFRARVEQQVSDFGYTLAEMESTLDRIRDQLRRLDTETQAQIISRHQDEAVRSGNEDFDPLEMDQYSHLQHLSRSLFESASDLYDLKESLASKARDTETLLLQQSRVNTELQEGLMRTRMVPFERTLPRLRRIVRQVAAELGKQVELQVTNAEGEMDRTVMERMVAPLEHLLRNAIGHGIEPAQVRKQKGKPEAGVIRIELAREGADIVLTMSDDGAGINIDAVRKKAIERGLMVADSVLTNHEIMQFILQSGFSTAERVTQVSGRGVGMDVVASEIKQIGGTVSIASEPDKGTSFTFRIPFTVSINRALMVLAGEDLYAVPLNVIEGILRVSPYELEALYEQAQETGKPASYEYAGQNYELRYIGELLGNHHQPKLAGQLLPLPVLLVRSNEHAMAVQVDSLAGSREIVVKSLGPQFADVHGISGATLLGDGRVVIILDLMALIRHLYANISSADVIRTMPQREQQQERRKLIMIVDDSVTVRKVTSRLLERNNMEVITAKDGMDAITQLHERKPDLMLLDIEMPRMDGFEVATQVRHDQELKDLPIIMITSRTGEKHRERAMAIGVNEYLGKPYQEAELLEKVRQLAL